MPTVIFHRLVQRDMSGILKYYTEEASPLVAERFFQTFLRRVNTVAARPTSFHPVTPLLRLADLRGFPYHFLFRTIPDGIRILVLRHDKRHPAHGLSRR